MPDNPLLRSERLDRLRRRESQLQARIQDSVARRRRNASRMDTRRKILAGAFFHRKYKMDGEADKLILMLDPYLVRPGDRALFGLPAAGGRPADPSVLNLDLEVPLRGIILIGAFFLEQYCGNGKLDELAAMMDPFLRRAADRRLFGLDAGKENKAGDRVDQDFVLPF